MYLNYFIEIISPVFEIISIIDLIYLVITTLSIIKCYNKGFVLSLLSASKWIFAYVVTVILFPRTKPYFKDIIDSEYVLDVSLGFFYICSSGIFSVLIINKAISKAVKFLGFGRLDSIFGFYSLVLLEGI